MRHKYQMALKEKNKPVKEEKEEAEEVDPEE